MWRLNVNKCVSHTHTHRRYINTQWCPHAVEFSCRESVKIKHSFLTTVKQSCKIIEEYADVSCLFFYASGWVTWLLTFGSRTQETSMTCMVGRSLPPCQSWWSTTQQRMASFRTKTAPSSSSNIPSTAPTPPQRGLCTRNLYRSFPNRLMWPTLPAAYSFSGLSVIVFGYVVEPKIVNTIHCISSDCCL